MQFVVYNMPVALVYIKDCWGGGGLEGGGDGSAVRSAFIKVNGQGY